MGYTIHVYIPGHGTVRHTAATIKACWAWYLANVRPDVATQILIQQDRP